MNDAVSTTSTVEIYADVTPVLSYAMAHNAIAFIDGLALTSRGADHPGAEVSIEVVDSEGVVSHPWSQLVDLSAGARTVLTDVRPRLDASALLQVDEQRPARVVVTVTDDEGVLGRRAFDVQLLAGQQWLARPLVLGAELLAAFVMPNHPAIATLLSEASDLLAERTGSGSLQGYQAGPERADDIARSVFEAMRARRIRYSNPPASWGDVGQKVRTPSQVLDDRMGTCLDTVVVMAAAYEQAGLSPMLFLVEGHIFLGYWRSDAQHLAEAVTTDASALVNAVDLGLVQLVETTMVTKSIETVPFEATHRPPYTAHLTGDLSTVEAVIDVVTARRSGILPLPARTRDADGAVQVTEYRPADHSAAPAAAASAETRTASRGSTSRPAPPPRVQQWKNALLDLSLRNRLISFKDASGLRAWVPDGHLAALEDLVNEGSMIDLLMSDRFAEVAAARGVRTAADLPQPFLVESLTRGHQLYVDLTADTYTSRLQTLAYKARTVVEETGANNLYLALGSLVWDVEGTAVRSPLILVPVRLTSRARQQAYRLQLDDSGTSTPNYCLLEKLRQLHGLELPALAEPAEDAAGVDLDAVLTGVRTALAEAGLPFRVEETAHLAILQFAKFRLWKDLDDSWESLTSNPLVRHLVHSPSDPFDDPVEASEDVDLDALAGVSPVPADATQLAAIADAVAGRTFVLEGPPGTGKSQTITNLLARCLAEGRRVLFVAEKRAALDVVRDRLDAVGMGAFSLDLHDKGSRPAVVRLQVKAALEHAVDVDEQGLAVQEQDLTSARRTLARYAQRVHEANGAGLSLYSARSALLALGGAGGAHGSADGDEPVLPVPDRLLEASGTARLAAARRALADLPDTADAASPSPAHPWGFVTRAPGRVDVDAAWRAARAVDAELEKAPSGGALGRAVAAVRLPAQLSAVAELLAGAPVTLEALDAVRSPAWAQEADAALAAATGFGTATHPPLRLATPGVFDLPLSDIAAQARAAVDAGWFGRKKRLREVLAQLAPGLRPDAEVPLTDVPDLAAALAQLQVSHVWLRERLSRVPGMALPATWDPLLPADRDGAQRRVAWLRSAAPAVDPSDAVGAAVREHVATTGAAGWAAVGDLRPLADGLDRAVRATGAPDAAVEAWAGDAGLVDRWRATSTSRASADTRQRSLKAHLAFLEALEPLLDAGLDDAHALLLTGAVPAEDAVRALDRGAATASVQERRATTGLASFSPTSHGRAVERFSSSSRAVRALLQAELPRQVLASRPFDARTGRGRIGELHHEVGKQRRGLGVRALMTRYGDLITQVMPCVLVSPDSLARFFPATAGLFDLVVFDEASQIRVADAVGAMGRAKAVVVVGDSKQMPPTSFGDSGDGGDDDGPAEEFTVAEDQESILDECVLARVPRQWLSWHYRSQDESLIAFSNRHYYEDRLSSFPAPSSGSDSAAGDRGVSLVRVDGHFHRSGAGKKLRTNPVEADAVVAEVRRRFAASPDAVPSIGVVTFNQQQRSLVEALLRGLGDDRIVAALDDAAEGLFVKNLENVQGDERDVILFSTAFSTNDKGVLPLNFGPLNRSGGERRLNVAVTRARRRVVVFSSFDPGQLRAEETSSVGIKHLRAYLDLASRGTSSLGVSARRLAVVDRHRDDVAAALRERGLVVTTDVGLSDFKVDLSVALPEDPDRSLVAVLLDGPGWAARRTVGDRDGLPVEVLSRLLGWPAVERVWLPAWLDDPTATVDAIERAARRPAPAAITPAPAAFTSPAGADDVPAATGSPVLAGAATADDGLFTGAYASSSLFDDVEDEASAPVAEAPVTAAPATPERAAALTTALPGEEPFVAWEPGVLGTTSVLDQLPQFYAADRVRAALQEAVLAEGPVQTDRLARSVARAFGLNRVQEVRVFSILEVLPPALQMRVVDGFVWPEHLSPDRWTGFRRAPVRGQRPVEQVSLREIGNAMVALCANSGGMDGDELCREALAVFGGSRMTAGISVRLHEALDAAVARERLTAVEGDYRAR